MKYYDINEIPEYLKQYFEEVPQLGLEDSPELYVKKMAAVFEEVRRILKKGGTLWLNVGDTYYSAKGQSGQTDSTNQDQRNKDGRSLNKKHQQLGGKKKTRPSDRPHPTLKRKDLVGIPWALAFALRDAGWYLRQDIIWSKPNPMPESVKDRCTKSHEYLFLLTKSDKYYFDHEAIQEEANYDGCKDTMMKGSEKYKESVVLGKKEHSFAAQGHQRWQTRSKENKKFGNRDGDLSGPHSGKDWNPTVNDDLEYVRNKRSVWTVNLKPFKEAHFATFPQQLIVDCIKAGCPEGGVVLDPFMGAWTTALVSRKLNRNYIGYEINPEFNKLGKKRLANELGLFQ